MVLEDNSKITEQICRCSKHPRIVKIDIFYFLFFPFYFLSLLCTYPLHPAQEAGIFPSLIRAIRPAGPSLRIVFTCVPPAFVTAFFSPCNREIQANANFFQ